MLPLIYKKKPKNGANANNNMLRIVINPDLKHFDAILAQELFEFGYKWKWLRGFVTAFSKKAQREMELRGHEVEVQWAVKYNGVDESEYRDLEAKALVRYKAFKGMSKEEIYRGMRKHSNECKIWVRKNTDYVLKKGK